MNKINPGRPKKEDECRIVAFSEVAGSYANDSRFEVAIQEVRRFLHSTGKKGIVLSNDVADLDVFAPFVLSMLWQIPVHAVVGEWIVNEDWAKVERWKRLCDVWNKRWNDLHKVAWAVGSFTSGWRLACMVAAWRLLDDYYLKGDGLPSVEEVSGAAVVWLKQWGVPSREMGPIERHTKREFEKISLEWLNRSGLKKTLPPLFPEGFQKYLEAVKNHLNCEPGYEPFSLPEPRQEDLERFERMRIEELEFLRLGCPMLPE